MLVNGAANRRMRQHRMVVFRVLLQETADSRNEIKEKTCSCFLEQHHPTTMDGSPREAGAVLRERKLEEGFEQRLAAEAAERPRRSTARSLMMALCVVTIALGILWIAVLLAIHASGPSRPRVESELSNEVGLVQQAVSALYSGQSDYDDLDDRTLVQSGRLPNAMAPHGVILNIMGGEVHVAGAEKGFSITMEKIPGWACNSLAISKDIGESPVSLQITSDASAGTPHAAPMQETLAQEDCGPENGLTSMQWTFH
jgi:hypothetical protein